MYIVNKFVRSKKEIYGSPVTRVSWVFICPYHTCDTTQRVRDFYMTQRVRANERRTLIVPPLLKARRLDDLVRQPPRHSDSQSWSTTPQNRPPHTTHTGSHELHAQHRFPRKILTNSLVCVVRGVGF